MTPTFRFAPSPNGRLHLGHAYSALLNARLAERFGGRFLVRLEDIDTIRCTSQLARDCLDDLRWLGLTWEKPVRVQSEHFADYAAALESLKARGLVYPCFCTRSDIAATATQRDPEGAPLYPGTCRHTDPSARLARGESHAWRLDMAKALVGMPELSYRIFTPESADTLSVPTHPARWGDVILARKDTPTSYHLSVVVDDALQGITHVVRGQDLEAATDIHVLLQRLLGLPTPLYHHHALIREEGGDKLAKSRDSESLAAARARGVMAEELRNFFSSSLREA